MLHGPFVTVEVDFAWQLVSLEVTWSYNYTIPLSLSFSLAVGKLRCNLKRNAKQSQLTLIARLLLHQMQLLCLSQCKIAQHAYICPFAKVEERPNGDGATCESPYNQILLFSIVLSCGASKVPAFCDSFSLPSQLVYVDRLSLSFSSCVCDLTGPVDLSVTVCAIDRQSHNWTPFRFRLLSREKEERGAETSLIHVSNVHSSSTLTHH